MAKGRSAARLKLSENFGQDIDGGFARRRGVIQCRVLAEAGIDLFGRSLSTGMRITIEVLGRSSNPSDCPGWVCGRITAKRVQKIKNLEAGTLSGLLRQLCSRLPH